MMKKLMVLLMVALGLSIAGVAHAANPVWTIDSVDSIGCGEHDTQFQVTFAGMTGHEYSKTTVDAGATRYMNENEGIEDNDHGTWQLYFNDGGGPATNAWPIPDDTPVTVHFLLYDDDTDDLVFDRELILSKCNGGEVSSNTVLVSRSNGHESGGGSSSGAGKPAGNLSDGRINNVPGLDVAAPVAIYQDAQGNVSIYAIDPTTGNGSLVAAVSKADLDAKGVPTGNLVLIDTTAFGLRVVVSRLPTGEIQVNVYGSSTYIVAWNPANPSSLTHLSG